MIKEFIKKYNNILWVILGYFIITIIFTYPLILHLRSNIYATSGDPFGTLHYLWWSKSHDISYNFPNSALFIGPAKLLTIIFGEVFAYNLFTIFGFVLTGIAGYLLVKKITRNHLAGFFSGLALLLCPYRLSQSLQHINFTDLSWLLFFIYFLLSSKKRPTLINILLCSIFFVITALLNYQYGFFALIILVVFIITAFVEAIISKNIRFDKQIAGFIVISSIFAILAVTVFSYQVFEDIVSIRKNKEVQVVPIRSESELGVYSARWFYYFYPSPQNPLFGKYTKDTYNNTATQTGSNLTEMELYIGWTLILLSLYYLISMIIRWKLRPKGQKFRVVFFVLIGIAGFYFSFAPIMPIFGLQIRTPGNLLFDYLPFFRVYARFGLMVIIALSILAGLGLSLILEKIKSRRIVLLLYLFTTILLIAEFTNFPPVKVSAIGLDDAPGVYQQFISENEDVKIAEYPLLPEAIPSGYDYLLWQRIHQKDLFNSDYFKMKDTSTTNPIIDINNPSTLKILKEYKVKYIILHKDKYLDPKIKEYLVGYPDLKQMISNLSKNNNINFIQEFGNDYLYEVIY